MGSAFGAIWEDPEGSFIKFVVKRALKQDQTIHMEGKLHVILYFREECANVSTPNKLSYGPISTVKNPIVLAGPIFPVTPVEH